MKPVSILTWNIQCGRGVDGVIDLGRIARIVDGMGGADVICLQEVARHDPDLDGGQGADQAELLSRLFPGHTSAFGAALDRVGDGEGRRRQFGNMILSRLPVLQVFRHALPQPAPDQNVPNMPRQALEVVVQTPLGPMRVTTTHLEYHSARQRMAQVARLQAIAADIAANASYGEFAPTDGPYAANPRPVRSVLCGDFNAEPGDDVYARLTTGQHDAWRLLNGDAPHAPTCGIYDHAQWPEGPHARDFFIVSDDLAEIVLQVEVNTKTDASDHQPVRMTLGVNRAQIG